MSEKRKILIEWFSKEFPGLLEQLKTADHNYSNEIKNLYHEEGPVWDHINLVFDVYEKSGKDDWLGWLAILGHDLGKPISREVDEENKKVTFLNHEYLGIPLAYKVYKKFSKDIMKLSDEDIINLLIMIKNHLRVFKIEKESKIIDIHNAFTGNKYREVFIDLANSDNKGRVSKYTLKEFKHEGKLRELMKDETSRENYVIKGPTANVLIGISGSGKSTYIKGENNIYSFDNTRVEIYKEKFKNCTINEKQLYNDAWDFCHITSKPEIDVYTITIKKAIEKLKEGEPIQFDNTNLGKKDRAKFLGHLPKDIYKKAIVFVPDFEREKLKNMLRKDKTVPYNVLRSQYYKFQFPDYSEFDEIIIIDN